MFSDISGYIINALLCSGVVLVQCCGEVTATGQCWNTSGIQKVSNFLLRFDSNSWWQVYQHSHQGTQWRLQSLKQQAKIRLFWPDWRKACILNTSPGNCCLSSSHLVGVTNKTIKWQSSQDKCIYQNLLLFTKKQEKNRL